VLDRLHAAGVRAVVYDVQFTEPTTEREDVALFDALRRTGGAVLTATESDDHGATNILGGHVREARSVASAPDLPATVGGQLDRVPYATGSLRSLAVQAARRVGVRPPRSAFGAGGARIDFRGPPGTIETISFADVYRGSFDPRLLRGRVVVVGATAPSLQDVHPTPMASEPMAGPEIEANAIWTVLHGLPLRDWPTGANVAVLVLLGLLGPLLRLRLRVLRATVAATVITVLGLVGAQLAFDAGAVLWVAAPLLAAALGTIGMIVASHLAETTRRRRIARDNELLEARVRERTVELREAQLEILERLSRAAEGRDHDTGTHVARIGQLSHRLALAIGIEHSEAEAIGHAAVAHDIGKISIPDRILLKQGPLDEGELHEMRRHVLVGASILSGSRTRVIRLAEEIARSHHERWDGSGYPYGIGGEEIPLPGRICAVADVFDALVAERPYKRAWTLGEALAELRTQSGSHFDPRLVEAFLRIAPVAYAELYGGEQAAGGLLAATR
jgi:response regulator RpfG family c-di-GMP phosphodiesterase